MVGRDAEIEVLGDAFEATAGRTPQLVLLDGEAGGGKSRLVAEFTRCTLPRPADAHPEPGRLGRRG